MRIAFCVEDLAGLRDMVDRGHADGTYVVMGYVAGGLQGRGHQVTFLAPRDTEDMAYATGSGEPVLAPRTWTTRRWFAVAGSAAWRVQRWLGIPYLNVFSNYRWFDAGTQCLPGHDVVYERNGLYNAGVARACGRLGLPYVLFFDADQILEAEVSGEPITGLLRWRASRLLRFNLGVAERVICVSEQARTHLTRAWGVAGEKIVVLPNGVDVGRFRPDDDARDRVRARLGVGARPLVVFAGSFFGWHDVPTLLDAFATVLASHPDARLLLVGDGRERRRMTERAATLGIGHAVQFTGLVPHGEVPSLLSAADIGVAPYPRLEQDLWFSPLKAFEYMATGLAIVASDVGQLSEVLRDGTSALLVPPGDAPAMAAALQRLIEDDGLRRRLGAQARLDAVARHSWERYLAQLEDVLSVAIAGHARDSRSAGTPA
jgi:glycosyltransferase involved in cell wall biosynthesis